MKMVGKKVLSAMLFSVLFLVACNAEEVTEDPNKTEDVGKEVTKDKAGHTFPTKTSNNNQSIEGDHLNYGLVTDSPFEGLLNWTFYQSMYDDAILSVFDESLLSTDENYVFNQEGAATYEMSKDNKTITLTIRDEVNWQDGNPVTGEDLEFAYLTIGHPDYKGARYDSLFQMIEGMEEYHAGKANSISGIKVDGKKISITFKEANPSILTGLWTYPLHKKYLRTFHLMKWNPLIKFAKIQLALDPYKVKKIVQGEAVEFEAYDGYWKGKPKLAGITLTVVNCTIAVKALESGSIDVAELAPIFMME